MNRLIQYLYIFLALVLMAASCKKEEEIDLLPPATQSGKNTFGCLVDGKAFLPKKKFNPHPAKGFKLEVIHNEGWFCQIFGLRDVSEGLFEVIMHTDSLLLEEGKTYSLASGIGEVTGSYVHYQRGSMYEYMTDGAAHTGQLHVTRFNREARIISGTFWYDAVNSEGVVVKIREGRFDFKYI
jgi:hypothetical protein